MTKPKGPPSPPPNDTTPRVVRARVLADAALRGDAAAAEANGVNVRTLRWWRFQLAEDVELATLYEVHVRRMADAWRADAATTLGKALRAIGRKIDDNVLDPFELVSVVRTIGEIFVTESALAPESDPDAGHAGAGASDPAQAGSASPSTRH